MSEKKIFFFGGGVSGKTSHFLGTHASIEVKIWGKPHGFGQNPAFTKSSLDRTKIKVTFWNFEFNRKRKIAVLLCLFNAFFSKC